MECWTDTMIRNAFPKQTVKEEIFEAFAPNAIHFPLIVLFMSINLALMVLLV